MRLVIAVEDAVARRRLERAFRDAGYELLTPREGYAALAALLDRNAPTVALLDGSMPGVSGTEIRKRISSSPRVIPPYMILLIANRGGGNVTEPASWYDDYVSKPSDIGEVLARVRTGVRILHLQYSLASRVKELEEAASPSRRLRGAVRRETHSFAFGTALLEEGERRLLRDGQPVPLASRVFDLLLLLVKNSGHLISKEEIMNQVWGDRIVEENNLTVSVSKLRKALGQKHGQGEYIQTVPKCGYRFVAPVTQL